MKESRPPGKGAKVTSQTQLKLYRVLLSDYRLVIGCSSEATNQAQAVLYRVLLNFSAHRECCTGV